MSKDLKIGIITAVYNSGKYFEDYLNGILNQTVKPNIVSIVDDGSKDDSAFLIHRKLSTLSGDNLNFDKNQLNNKFIIDYEIKGIKFVFSSDGKNGGPAKARNLASIRMFEKCPVEIIFVNDSDDIYYRNKIEETIKVFQKYPSATLVYSDYDTFDEKKSETKREYKEPYSYRRLVQECIVSNNSAFDAKAFFNCGAYDESLFGPEDYDLWFRLAESGPVFHIPKALYKYRISGNNITISTPKEKFAAHVQRVHQKRIKRTG